MRCRTAVVAIALSSAVAILATSARAADEDLDAFGQLAAQAVRYEYRELPEGFPTMHAAGLGGIAEMAFLAEFEPPRDALARVHFADDTTCDAMAVDYRMGLWPVRLVTLAGVVVLAIDVGKREFASPEASLQFVRDVVLRVFERTARLNITAEALPDGTLRGRQVTQWASADERWQKAEWLDSLCWWYDGAQLRFGFSLWRPGSSLMLSPTFEDNHYWFRYCKPGAPPPADAPQAPPEGQ